ncbi:MAG TPA: hypothetical protein VMF13_03265 [Luteitalea sp.]|nr:hypothetical protein [Luteitalea sp.]
MPRAEVALRLGGAVASVAGLAVLVWLFVQQPTTFRELTGGVAATVGAYRINQADFDQGRQFFAADKFPEARAAFERADPASRHAETQFYIAYSWYRQGWGRVYSDDQLFGQGLMAVNRAIAVAPDGRVRVDDPALDMKTADELKDELEQGLRRDASDFNPMRVLRKRR